MLGRPAMAIDEFALQAGEEAFCHSVIVGIPNTAHENPHIHSVQRLPNARLVFQSPFALILLAKSVR